MNAQAAHTTAGRAWLISPILLGLLCLGVPACTSAPVNRGAFRAQNSYANESSGRHPAIVVTADNQAVKQAAADELGESTAAMIPDQVRPAPQPIDPGAAAVVNTILNSMNERIVGADGVTHISLQEIRNQSRATCSEFREFCERLAAALNHAANDGRGPSVRFTCDETQTVHYRVQGAAYVINAGGFDMWELFLSMTPRDRDWSVWQAERPVRVLRQPRPGQPQFVAW